MPTSLFVPRRVGLSANGLLYSRGSGGVKNDRVGGEYDGIFPECMGNVGYFLLWPKMPILLINHFLQINHFYVGRNAKKEWRHKEDEEKFGN